MVKIFTKPFAVSGTKETISDLSQPDGKVSYEDGFTSDYELPDTDPNYRPIERSEFNGLMHAVTEAVGEMQQFGFAKWQPGMWPQNARVVHASRFYRARIETSQPLTHDNWRDETPVTLEGNEVINGSKYFTKFPRMPSSAPTIDDEAVNKKYVDDKVASVSGGGTSTNAVLLTGNQTVGGTKTFTSFPITPSNAPTSNYQTANKKYVDDKVASVSGGGTSTNAVLLTGNQMIYGIKTFTEFPALPAAIPTTNYQAANKKYVDDKVASVGGSLGVGQTWQDMTGSRVLGAVYTNTTGRSILVNISVSQPSNDTRFSTVSLTVEGVFVARSVSRNGADEKVAFVSAIVPAGASYAAVNSFGDISIWAELR